VAYIVAAVARAREPRDADRIVILTDALCDTFNSETVIILGRSESMVKVLQYVYASECLIGVQ